MGMELWQVIATSSVLVAVVKLVETLISGALAHRRTGTLSRLSKVEVNAETTRTRLDALAEGQRASLRDRIRYLGKCYLRDGCIDLEDRGDLIEMHRVYHDALGGNGNLDRLMADVLKLPLKGR